MIDKRFTSNHTKYVAVVVRSNSPAVCDVGEKRDDDRAWQLNINNSGGMYAAVYLPHCPSTLDDARSGTYAWRGSIGAARYNPQVDEHAKSLYDHMNYGVGTYLDGSASFFNRRYDCNDNDYYATSPGGGEDLSNHWNTADGVFLVGS